MNCHFFIVHKCFKWLSTCISCGRTSGGCGGEKVSRQWAAYFRALSSTPEADQLTVRTLQRRCVKARSAAASPPSVFYARYACVILLGSIDRGKKQNLIPSASTPMSSVSPRGRKLRTSWPSPQDPDTVIRGPNRFPAHRWFFTSQRPGRLGNSHHCPWLR